jgi:RNA polymerase sigma factor (TIGR02999 family)
VNDDANRVLQSAADGDPHAAAELLPLVYNELRRLAAQRMASEQPGRTLGATALVHEAYIRLVGDEAARRWNGRGHFFAAAAEAMRRILIEQARRRHSRKRGGDMRRVDLDASAFVDAGAAGSVEDLLALDEALRALEADDPAKAQLVKLRYFAGLSVEQAAEAMGISEATAKRYWVYARSWLFGKLRDAGEAPGS